MIESTPLLDFFKRGEAARDVRLLAAQGALAPRAQEQLALLILLLDDQDSEIRSTADQTLNKIPLEAWLAGGRSERRRAAADCSEKEALGRLQGQGLGATVRPGAAAAGAEGQTVREQPFR